VSLEVLIAALRELGMDIKPFEALREYARQLDEKERDVSRKIEELQRLLDAIRHARSVLKQLGV
jgi:vacuolar-type H+-ATPase subunit I/STV1